MSEKILIIDDEQDIADLLEVYLKNENYVVHKFYCATDAMSCIESGDIDLAILDIMLPDMNGFSLCQLIRKKYTYPIIMLTAKIEETDKITGLTLGADDYVTKPFRPLEVVARVKAQLRRYKKYSPGIITEKIPSELSYNKLCLNVQTHECLLDGEPVSLTPTEFSILHVLLSSAGNVVSIEEQMLQATNAAAEAMKDLTDAGARKEQIQGAFQLCSRHRFQSVCKLFLR